MDGPRRVLCVDDDTDSCEMLTVYIGRLGYSVEVAQNPADALRIAREQKFEFIILDSWLPEMDGFDLCRQIRSFDQDTPIIFYSAAAYDKDARAALEAGADAYIPKPHIDRLVASFKQLHRSRKP